VSKLTDNLDSIAEQIRQDFSAKDTAREKALPLDQAAESLKSARNLLTEAAQAVAAYSELSNTGFIRDAQKEFAEGSILLALVTGKQLPDPGELGIEAAAYLNGLGEAVGELRRYLLDGMRQGDLSRSEELLLAMDDIYNVLVTIDFPDAITGGLRRTTDMVRGVLERTRSDLTLVMRQKDLENRLEKFKDNIH